MESPSLNISKQQVLEVGDQLPTISPSRAITGWNIPVVAVGFAGMLGRKDDITALVADEIFIIRRDQMNRSGAESSGAAGFMNIELTAFPRFLNEFVTNDFRQLSDSR